MKLIGVFFCLFLFEGSLPLFAQTQNGLYRIILVKGSPLRSGKEKLRDGQKIEDNEKVMFTTISDVAILLNVGFDKIYLRPKSPNQLKRLLKVSDFVNETARERNALKNVSVNVRGLESSSSFQSLKDTIKLHIVNDLKRSPDSPLSSFKLFNLYMEPPNNVLKIEGEYLVIYPGKVGFYNLHFTKGNMNSEVLAEIEFLDKEEIRAELNFISNSTANKDSVMNIQKKYAEKLYPKVPKAQLMEVLSNNK